MPCNPNNGCGSVILSVKSVLFEPTSETPATTKKTKKMKPRQKRGAAVSSRAQKAPKPEKPVRAAVAEEWLGAFFRLIAEKKLPKAQVARDLRVSYEALRKWGKGDITPAPENRRRIKNFVRINTTATAK